MRQSSLALEINEPVKRKLSIRFQASAKIETVLHAAISHRNMNDFRRGAKHHRAVVEIYVFRNYDETI
jgi:hypothetical protein